MLNTTSLNAVSSSTFSQQSVKPLYDSYCFSNIPQTIEFLLTGEGQSALPLDVFGDLPTRYDRVILFFVDAFGWRFFERYAEKYEFLKIILKHGVVSKMTSQFPSTTAVHATCIHTGLDVGQSGIYEWQYYEPLVDDIILPLLFSYARNKNRDTLKRAPFPPEQYFPSQTLYQKLKSKGVVSYVFQHQAYTPSTFSDCVFQGAHVVPFRSPGEALSNLTDIVLAHKAPPYYYFVYFDRIDTMCHLYGPASKQFEQEVENFLLLMEQMLYQKIRGKVPNTLLLMTADHGHIEVDPRTTIYLNQQAAGISQFLQVNQRGKLMVPAGSARDMFLHIKAGCLDEAVAYLRKRLEGRADIYKTADLLARHFFGLHEPSQQFLNRVGNVVVLPYPGETTWWYEEGIFGMHFFGHHGGLTPQEMEIPFMALPI